MTEPPKVQDIAMTVDVVLRSLLKMGTPLSSEARVGSGAPPRSTPVPVQVLAGGCSALAVVVVVVVVVVVAMVGGGSGSSSRETVTPQCFVNCFSQLVCSGLGLERHRMEV
jgi:hypothetical protein